jgi:hypothetical protein
MGARRACFIPLGESEERRRYGIMASQPSIARRHIQVCLRFLAMGYREKHEYLVPDFPPVTFHFTEHDTETGNAFLFMALFCEDILREMVMTGGYPKLVQVHLQAMLAIAELLLEREGPPLLLAVEDPWDLQSSHGHGKRHHDETENAWYALRLLARETLPAFGFEMAEPPYTPCAKLLSEYSYLAYDVATGRIGAEADFGSQPATGEEEAEAGK